MRLILTRHAKSDWTDAGAEDHDRVLNERGRRAAPAIGRWLRSRGYLPDEVLCSSALRTRETAELILGELDGAPAPTPLPELYSAGVDGVLRALKRATGATVMLVGHNPTMGDFAAEILSQPPLHPGFGGYPTGATLVAEIDGDGWAGLRPGTARALDFVVPRDLD